MRISDWSSDVCSSDLGRHKEDRRSNDFRRARTGGRRCPQGVDRLSAAPHQESADCKSEEGCGGKNPDQLIDPSEELALVPGDADANDAVDEDRKSTRLNSSH